MENGHCNWDVGKKACLLGEGPEVAAVGVVDGEVALCAIRLLPVKGAHGSANLLHPVMNG